MMTIKRPFFLIAPVILFCFLNIAATNSDYINANFSELYGRHQIEKMGDQLVEQGRYEDALEKYHEVLSPKYIKYEHDKATVISRITKTLMLLQRYDEALQEWQWFIDQSEKNAARLGRPNNGEAELKAKEILALKAYKESGNPQSVYDYLKFYKQKKSRSLPPSFEWGASPTEVSTILRLYDTVGDCDAGIALIDEVLAFFRTGKAGDPKLGKVDHEYMKIREAFKKDKAEGAKGRATKALIQSDYFPW